MQKKLFSIMMALLVLLATVPTTAYAANYETTHKVDSSMMYGHYWYQITLEEGGKLVAKGKWNHCGHPEDYNIEFQVVQPVSWGAYVLNPDATASFSYETYAPVTHFGGKIVKTVPVVRSVSCKGTADGEISFTIDTSGIPSGIYQLQEIVSSTKHAEGNLSCDLFLLMFNGTSSIEASSYAFYWLTDFWTNYWLTDYFGSAWRFLPWTD